MRSPLHIGLVGLGRWGGNYPRRFAEMSGVRVAAICDIDEGRLAAARACSSDAEAFDDPARFLDSDVDGIVIATPAETHAALASAALERGKHVLVEKPLALRPDAAEALVSLAMRAKRVLAVGHLSLHNRALRDAVEGIGRVRSIVARRASLGAFRSNESALFGLASHDVATVVGLLRMPVTRARARPLAVEDGDQSVRVDLDLAGGASARIEASRLGPARLRELTLHGSRGTRVIDELANERAGADLLAIQCARFVERIRHGDWSGDEARVGLAVIRVLSAAERSMCAGGEWIDLDRAAPALQHDV